jgi:hypothetical protein
MIQRCYEENNVDKGWVVYGEDIKVTILPNHQSSAECSARHEVTSFDFEYGDTEK